MTYRDMTAENLICVTRGLYSPYYVDLMRKSYVEAACCDPASGDIDKQGLIMEKAYLQPHLMWLRLPLDMKFHAFKLNFNVLVLLAFLIKAASFLLKSLQVTGVASMTEQEKSPLKRVILADSCDLGKTINSSQ